jgi:hypothetical protein
MLIPPVFFSRFTNENAALCAQIVPCTFGTRRSDSCHNRFVVSHRRMFYVMLPQPLPPAAASHVSRNPRSRFDQYR